MTLSKLFQSAIVIAVTAWIFYEVGKFIDPERSWDFALIGSAIAAIATLLVIIDINEQKRIIIGSFYNSLAFLLVGFF